MAGLELTDVSVSRGGFPVVRDISLSVTPGTITVLLGPNGAGKTTLLEALSGLLPVNHGRITLDGGDITRASRVKRARLGLAHVEQGRAVFGELTVRENILVAARNRPAGDRAIAYFPELEPRLDIAAAQLSGGEQQMLVLARALSTEPKILLVDEMSLGLAPVIVHRLLPVFSALADEGIGVLLIEQYAALVLRYARTCHVMTRGEIRVSGPAADFAANPGLLHAAYLGETNPQGSPSSSTKSTTATGSRPPA